jgi:homoserine dehydrogenase
MSFLAHGGLLRPSPRPLRVVLLGLGNVGRGVFDRLLAEPHHFEVLRVVVRDPARHAAANVPAALLSSNPWDALNLPADVVIEALGGESPAAEILHAALLRGRRIVSANKLAVVAGWPALHSWAEGRAPQLRFSAAVGGEVPVLETLSELAQRSRVRSVRGVLNGTCNFVLDRISAGLGYGAAVAEAQSLGFAEPDPAADVSGLDAECKLRLAAWAAFGRWPDAVRREGIEGTLSARRAGDGHVLRLVAQAERAGGRLAGSVAPRWCAPDDYLAGARGEENRVEIVTDSGERIRLAGKGAGRAPTTAAVFGDLDALWREHAARGKARWRRPALNPTRACR